MHPSSQPLPPDPPTWQRLDAARQGSLADLGALFQAARPYLLRVAREDLAPALRGKADGSDLVQQTFLEAQQALAAFHGTSLADFVSWLRRILKNNIADFQRRYSGTERRRPDRERPLAGDAYADPEPSPSKVAMRREETERLEAAIDRLPEDYRQVLLLRYREHLAYAEIAALLGRSEDAVQKVWTRAVVQLQGELGGGR